MTYSNRQLVTGLEELRELDGLASRVTLSTRRVDSLQLAGPFFFGGRMVVNVGGHSVEIDEDDLWLLADRPWHISQSYSGRFYVRSNGKNKVYFHRVIMGAEAHQEIDHIDNNSLNNEKSNLRFCTRTQNNFNSRARKSKSGLKGAMWSSEKRKWFSKIKVSGRDIHLGYFTDPKEAHEAYIKAAVKYAGEFARW